MSEKLHQYCYENQYFIKPKLIWLGFCYVKTLGFILKLVTPKTAMKFRNKTFLSRRTVILSCLINFLPSMSVAECPCPRCSQVWVVALLSLFEILSMFCHNLVRNSIVKLMNLVPQYWINIIANFRQINFLQNFSSFNWFTSVLLII